VDVEEGRGESGIGKIDDICSIRCGVLCSRGDGDNTAVFENNHGVVDETASIVELSCGENHQPLSHWKNSCRSSTSNKPMLTGDIASTIISFTELAG
jgi:hypothetical protein